ncbi:hypothetical protein TSUD_101800 [Trifolium subterraneum]|uniref:Endonuclease/exonuclease/phosphatase domain-containing protein n=1 Tax=Trifolium subterraneum TaxID=3900 RepID=A0A2Z6NAP5_TRISU|nr:hypothetical protein TSUD_101800 [Trifolium subterraneum]
MKLLSWNIRGIGGLEKRKEVCRLVGEKKPFIVCIQETKMQSCDVFFCSFLWGSSPHAFSFRPSVGVSGGLLTMWDTSEVEVWSSTSREHVLWCHRRFLKAGEEFYLANVYAPCEMGAKQSLWNSLLGRIHLLNGERVCVCWDFNAVRSIEERRSFRAGSRSSDHIPFNQFIDDVVLIDLPLSGRKFTWYKGDGLAMSCLDRFLLSEEWCLTWPNCAQVAQLRGLSDHCPLVLEADEKNWGSRPSRMLKCWKDIPGYQQFVRDKWNAVQIDGWGGFVLKEKFKMIRLALKEWYAAHSQSFPGRIDSLKVRLSVFEHFASHFKESDVARPGVDNLQFKRLTLLEGGSLTKPFSLEEVKTAVWDCDSFKSPGPDGLNFGFIKDFWSELQADVMRFIAEFHHNGKLTKGLNSTFITLIPKVDSPQHLNDFQPISLVGSLYKILAKVLANRLQLVFGSVISESQTAFVKDRKILDGILIANEVVDEAHAVMGRMSFPILWRKWIKECICTASTSVLVNGSPTEEFPLQRGLRQVDPLYSFLFLLAAEGLNILMQAMVDHQFFSGYSFGTQNQIFLSHLQFADDTLLLGTKRWSNVRALRVVLVLFETMSGSKVFNKSMLVGVNIADSWLRAVASALRCKVGKTPFLYLGLPIGWKSRFLSFGGRLVLLKSVLTSLPVYVISFFKAPSGVRRLREFNLALLDKWCWRMLVDRGCLWFRALAAWYGVERGCVREGARNGSSWWREIVRIRDGVDDLGGRWFREGVVRKVGDGTESYFWTDPWLVEYGGRNVLFRVGIDTGGEAWEWRRHLWAWEEMLGECQVLLHDFILQAQLSDTWIWRLDPVSGYSVRGAYQLLTSHPSDPLDVALDLIWHKQRLRIAWLDGDGWRQLNTYLFHAVSLVLSGHPLGRGLTSHR